MKKNYGIFVLAAIGLLNFAPLTPVFAAEVPAIGSIACEADSFLGNDEAYPVEAVEAASTAITPDTQPAPVNPGTTTPDTQPAPINPGTTTPDTQPAPINPGTTTPDTQPAPINPGTTKPDTQPAPINPGTTKPDTQPAPINPGTTKPAPGKPGTTKPAPGKPGTTKPDTKPAPGKPGTTKPDTQPTPITPGTAKPDTKPAPITPGTAKPSASGGTSSSLPDVLDPATGRTRPLLKAAAVPGEIDIYYVRLGDTLWKISRKYKTSLDCVIRYNPHLPDPDLIYPGDEIAVPLS